VILRAYRVTMNHHSAIMADQEAKRGLLPAPCLVEPARETSAPPPRQRADLMPELAVELAADATPGARAAGTAIRVTDCAKTFPDGTRALLPLNLSIDPGEKLVILGPSGCGKTTLLRIIAGLEAPDLEGSVHFDEEDVTGLPIEARRVGMVFQSYALFPTLNVAGNILFPLRLRRVPKPVQKARLAQLSAFVGIEGLEHRRIHELSGGQKQRVALARALAVEPRVLLLDEPLTALDASLRERLRSELSSLLNGLGITAIYVTHDQSEAMALADRIIVMDRGQIAQIGTPRQIYEQPATPFVATFIGATSLIPARAHEGYVHVQGSVIAPSERRGDVFLVTRPEDLEPAENGPLHGVIREATYFGDRKRLLVILKDGPPITVDVSPQSPLAASNPVRLRFRSASPRILAG
jgi:putative spermidine/putrescine transport system ATP-binding protein